MNKFYFIFLTISLFSLTSFKSDYISKYSKLAMEEQARYGIPASVTLAQGILESGWGESHAAVSHNNHFGIRCQKKIHNKECADYIDAGEKIRIMKYLSVKDSYRAHSIYLTTTKYKDLKSTCGKSYSWCNELQHRGYSADKKYAEKLKNIIRKYNLEQFDVYI